MFTRFKRGFFMNIRILQMILFLSALFIFSYAQAFKSSAWITGINLNGAAGQKIHVTETPTFSPQLPMVLPPDKSVHQLEVGDIVYRPDDKTCHRITHLETKVNGIFFKDTIVSLDECKKFTEKK